MLHPFMPFITEEIYSALPGAEGSIMVQKWPRYEPNLHYAEEEQAFQKVMDLIKAVRAVRNDMGVPPSKKTSMVIETAERSAL